jgi:hypothetical protein
MNRALAVSAFLVVVSAALAAPVPPVFFKSGWDSPVDPDNDCKFLQDTDRLTIVLPGKAHDLVKLNKLMNAPRLLREVKGDFRVEVRVSGDWTLSADSTVEDDFTYVAGGLLIMWGDENDQRVDRLEFGISDQFDSRSAVACFRHFPVDKAGGLYDRKSARDKDWPLENGANHLYLRFECRANTLRAFSSADGKKWIAWDLITPCDVRMTAKTKVGLAAYSTSNNSCKVHFDHFDLSSLAKQP